MADATAVIMRDPQKGGQPRVVVLVDDGQEFQPLLSFFRQEGMSISGERGHAYAVVRFLNWLQARGTEFGGIQRKEALKAFGVDLRDGTIRNEEDTPEDPTGLWWRSTSIRNANLACSRITRFSDWCAEEFGTVPLNPERPLASAAEQIRYWAAWGRVKKGSLLGHLKTAEQARDGAKWTRAVKQERELKGIKDPKKFPEELISALLSEAWLVCPTATLIHERYDLRGLAISLLLLYGGLRISEALLLWAIDIPNSPDDPGNEPLEVHHPSEGWVQIRNERTGALERLRRADYLIRSCGRRPLTQEVGRQYAGWKNPLLTDVNRKTIRVFWLDQDAAEMFYVCWRAYLLHSRPVVLRTPWAWLTKEGQPIGVAAFEELWATAMRRIGIKADKNAGTSPHGLRHRYGTWWNFLEFDNDQVRDKFAQIALHHQSLFAQEVYRAVGHETVAAALQEFRNSLFPASPLKHSGGE